MSVIVFCQSPKIISVTPQMSFPLHVFPCIFCLRRETTSLLHEKVIQSFAAKTVSFLDHFHIQYTCTLIFILAFRKQNTG